MNTLIILQEAPYGTERSYNGLRLAAALLGAGSAVRIFLLGDASGCGKRGQNVPSGYYNIETMLSGLAKRGVDIGVCGSCMDARGITEEELVGGLHRGSMARLAEWTQWADTVASF
ncbi:MAG: DsrE/DsrF/TusD sulfur relay family protein [Gemmatimonadota bacterium]